MLEQLRQTWQGLERRQQASLVALGALMLGGLIAVGLWAARPAWAVLYSELSPQHAQAVVEQLREQGVSYRLAQGGTAVLVPQERLYELRIQLAGEGLPAGSNAGFELFDHASFSTSDLQNNVNLQRALQGELERSICALEEIASARVHLALPEERLFSEHQEPPGASVVVRLANSRLGNPQVAAITQLVASAVPALQPDAVTVVDTLGRVLTGGPDGAGGLQTLAQLEATRAWEERVRACLQSMLDSVLGANRSVVRVQATLDFQSQQITREAFEPPDGEGVLRTEEITQEQYEGTGGAEVGGPAGLDGSAAPSRGDGGSYEHRHEKREYDYARVHEQVANPPGRLQRLAIAVVIDEGLGDATVGQVRGLVEAAAGLEPERGDQVTVEMMAIEAVKVAEKEAELVEVAEAARTRAQSIGRALRCGSVIVMLAMIAGAMLMVSRRLGAGREAHDAGEESSGPEAAAPRAPEEEAEGAEEELEFAPMSVRELRAQTGETPPAEQAGADARERLVDRLSDLGTRSPEDFARYLSGWLKEPAGSGRGDDDGDGDR